MKKYAIIFMLVAAGQTKAAQMALITDVQKLSNEVTQNINNANPILQNSKMTNIVNPLLKQATNVTNTKQQLLQLLKAQATNPSAITQIKGSMDKLKTMSENINAATTQLKDLVDQITAAKDQLNTQVKPVLKSIEEIFKTMSPSTLLAQLKERHADLVTRWDDLQQTSESFLTITSLDKLSTAVTSFKELLEKFNTDTNNLENDVKKGYLSTKQEELEDISSALSTIDADLQTEFIPQSAILTQLKERCTNLAKKCNDLKKTSESLLTVTLDGLSTFLTTFEDSIEKIITDFVNFRDNLGKLDAIAGLQNHLNEIGDPRLSSIITILQSGLISSSAILTQLKERHTNLVKQWNDLKKICPSVSAVTSLDELGTAETTIVDSITKLDIDTTHLDNDVKKEYLSITQKKLENINSQLNDAGAILQSGSIPQSATLTKLKERYTNLVKQWDDLHTRHSFVTLPIDEQEHTFLTTFKDSIEKLNTDVEKLKEESTTQISTPQSSLIASGTPTGVSLFAQIKNYVTSKFKLVLS